MYGRLWLCGVKVFHICCGARSCIFGFVGGVSISCCGCELCLVAVVFDVALRVGTLFVLNLVSPVQLSPSSLLCSFFAWRVVWGSLVVVLALALVC